MGELAGGNEREEGRRRQMCESLTLGICLLVPRGVRGYILSWPARLILLMTAEVLEELPELCIDKCHKSQKEKRKAGT